MNAFTRWYFKQKALRTVADIFGNNFSDEGCCQALFFCWEIYHCFPLWTRAVKSYLFWKRGRRSSENVLTMLFPLGGCIWSKLLVFFQAETGLLVSVGSLALTCEDASPFSAGPVLWTASYCSSRASGRELLQNVFFKPSPSGLEFQCHHRLAVWHSANCSTSLSLSVGVPICLRAVPTLELPWVITHRALRIMSDVSECSVSAAAAVNNDKSKTT